MENVVYFFSPSFAMSSVYCPGLTGKEPLWHLLVQQGTDAIRADKIPWATSPLVLSNSGTASVLMPLLVALCVPPSLLPHRQPWSFSPMQSEVWFLEAFWIWIHGCGKATGISGRVRDCHHTSLQTSGGWWRGNATTPDCSYCFSYMLCLVLPLCKRRKIGGYWKT